MQHAFDMFKISLLSLTDFFFLNMAMQLLQRLLKSYSSSPEVLLHLSKIIWAFVSLFLAQYLMAL